MILPVFSHSSGVIDATSSSIGSPIAAVSSSGVQSTSAWASANAGVPTPVVAAIDHFVNSIQPRPVSASSTYFADESARSIELPRCAPVAM